MFLYVGCGLPDRPAVNARVSAVATSWIKPLVCWNTGPGPLPEYCANMTVDLPLSLRVDMYFAEEYSNNRNRNLKRVVDDDDDDGNDDEVLPELDSASLLQRLNISWGLYQVDPPMTLYEMQGGVEIVDNHYATTNTTSTSPAVAISRHGNHRRELRPMLGVSQHFDNLEPGMYYFRLHQEIQDILYRGTFSRIQIIQGNATTTSTSSGGAPQHAWLDVNGSNFAGLLETYFTVSSSMDVAQVQPPTPGMSNNDPTNDDSVFDDDDWNSGVTDVYIDVMYDNAPLETSWWLRNLYTNETIFEIAPGEATVPGLMGYQIGIPNSDISDEFEFQMWDTVGDGICCEKGFGWVQAWLGTDELLWNLDGNFTDGHSIQFFI